MRILMILPAYNEEKNIVSAADQIRNCRFSEGIYVDIIVINDGSKDKTEKVCRDNGIPCISLVHNLGIGGAVQTGYIFAAMQDYDIAVQFDGDGQHRPEFIEPMRKKMEEGYEIVIGSRFVNAKKDWSMRMVGSRLIEAAIRLTTGVTVNDPTSGMRMFNRAMVEEFAQNLNYGPEPDTISYLIKNGATVKEVQVEMGERLAGQSYLTFWRSVQYMVKMSISILLIQWFRKRDTETPYPERSL